MGRRDTAIKNLQKAKSTGRPRGVKNKFTNLKESFLVAFEDLGGVSGLVKWAKKNQGQFYQIISRLFPKEIQSEVSVETYEERLRRLMGLNEKKE